MLVLKRNEGESLILILPNGDQVCICLTEYMGQQTKVSIEAPDDVQILRGELVN